MKWSLSCYSLVWVALLGVAGCQHVGPRTVVVDRLAYNEAIADSWKEQALLNLVRARYFDVTEFVDVSSVLSGYQHDLTGSATIGSMLFPNDPVKHILSPGFTGGRAMSDRPTITYTPQTGAEFMRNLLNPISAVSLANLLESGMRAEVVLGLAVEAINGIHNRQLFRGKVQPADPQFQQVLQTLTNALAQGGIGFRIRAGTDKSPATLFMTIQDKDIPPSLAEELAQMRKTLRLDPTVHEFEIVHGLLPQAKNEIAIRTRSIERLITFLCLHVQVPGPHLAEGLAPDLGDSGEDPDPPLTVDSGLKKPCNTYAAVHYQGYWFWIDPRDTNSKRSMAYLKRFLALADTGQKAAPPALTIRAN